MPDPPAAGDRFRRWRGLSAVERRERAEYFAFAERQRAGHESERRDRLAKALRAQAREREVLASVQEGYARRCVADDLTESAEYWSALARDSRVEAVSLERRAAAVLAGAERPEWVDVEADWWFGINDDIGALAPGGVESGAVSRLTGSCDPPPVDTTRPYGERRGLMAAGLLVIFSDA